MHLTLGRVVETRDEDVAHHEVDEPDAASSGACGKTITIYTSVTSVTSVISVNPVKLAILYIS